MDHYYLLRLLSIASVLCFGFLVRRHVGSQLPNQGSNLHLLHGKGSPQGNFVPEEITGYKEVNEIIGWGVGGTHQKGS